MTGPPGPGHNRGPTMEPGAGWRTHCWGAARRELLPHLPLEVIRMRVARAREIGLDYRIYATVRATSSHDIVAFLFSSNALRIFAARDRLPADRVVKLGAIQRCGRVMLAHAPLDAAELAAEIEANHLIRLDGAGPAPRFTAPWSDIRADVLAVLGRAHLPAGGVLLVGDTDFEREWCAAGRLAGYLPADRYFPPAAS